MLNLEKKLQDKPKLSEEVKSKLYELQQKGINIDELILNAIETREQEISETKEEFAKEQGPWLKRHATFREKSKNSFKKN